MAKISILIAFLPHLLYAIVQDRQSHCSQYFTYMPKPGITDMLGQIEIPPPVANDIFYLKVALSTTTELSQVVRLELARSIKESVRHVLQGEPLLYHVYYPMNEQIPSLSAIWFNGQQYCPDPEDENRNNLEISENITANVELGHILFPPNEEPLVYGPWQEISQPYHRNSSNYRIDNPSYDRLNHYSGLNKCGFTSYYTDDTNRLISDGEEWLPGQWPWLVAIYKQDNEKYSFLCAGTLLSTRHVLTHHWCIIIHLYGLTASSIELLKPQRLWVLFGQLNSRNWNENHTGIINRVVSYYTIFSLNQTFSSAYGLAILHLKTPVEYHAFIRPICLWSGTTNLQDTVNMTGYFVGWGSDIAMNESGYHREQYTGVPRMAKLPLSEVSVNIFGKNEIYHSHKVYRNYTCCTDEGGGLVVFNTTMGRYQLRALTIYCTLPGTKFFDVAKSTSWIRQQILLT